MLQVLWRARGGQGAFTAARVLGAAAALGAGGLHALAFPAFGPERRGAPMRAFTKIAHAPIGDRSAIARADVVVYLDETLFDNGFATELAPGGHVFVNSAHDFADARVTPVDANALSAAVLGRAIPNTTFLGVLAAVLPGVTLDDIILGIKQCMPAKLQTKNIEVVRQAYDLFAEGGEGGVPAGGKTRASREATSQRCVAEFSCEKIMHENSSAPDVRQPPDSHASCPGTSVQVEEGGVAAAGSDELVEFSSFEVPVFLEPTRVRSRLVDVVLDPAVYACDTCGSAGMLTQANSGWREVRPVVDDSLCTGCFQCYMACPDGTIFKPQFADGSAAHPLPLPLPKAGDAAPDAPARPKVAIDLDFCKGCGICAHVCPAGCITMQSEAVQADANPRPGCATQADIATPAQNGTKANPRTDAGAEADAPTRPQPARAQMSGNPQPGCATRADSATHAQTSPSPSPSPQKSQARSEL